MAHRLCELILALIACAVGLSIVVVEWLIIAEEAKGTPGFFILLHRMVAMKGVVQFLGGVLLTVRVCRGGIKLTIANLVIASMNTLSLTVQISMVAFGIHDAQANCQKYSAFCTPGSSLQYGVTLLQSQEANFVIATVIDFIYVVILCKYLSAITSNLSTMNEDERGEDKVLYSKVAN